MACKGAKRLIQHTETRVNRFGDKETRDVSMFGSKNVIYNMHIELYFRNCKYFRYKA